MTDELKFVRVSFWFGDKTPGHRFVSEPMVINSMDETFTVEKWLDNLATSPYPHNPVTLQMVQDCELPQNATSARVELVSVRSRKIDGRWYSTYETQTVSGPSY